MIEAISEAARTDVSRETFAKIENYVARLIAENQQQNLIAKSSENDVWGRHIVDSAQLIAHAPGIKNWVDIGSGAGLPGLVLAILSTCPITLVEPRALRAGFLERMTLELNLPHVTVVRCKVAALEGRYDVITARAVAPASDLVAMTLHLAHADTLFVFPKGRSANSELEVANQAWQGDFRLEPSVTSDEASILVAAHVKARGKL